MSDCIEANGVLPEVEASDKLELLREQAKEGLLAIIAHPLTPAAFSQVLLESIPDLKTSS
jgi:hypothetical protein